MPRLDAESGSSSESDSDYESASGSPALDDAPAPSRKEQRAQDLRSVRSTYGDASARGSALRRAGPQTGYAGVPTTSAQMFDDASEEEDDDSESADGDEESDSENGQGLDSVSEGERASGSAEDGDSMSDGEEEGVSAGSGDDGDGGEDDAGDRGLGASLAAQQADEAKLAMTLASQREQDARKGRSVQKQRAAYELALDLRIRSQKVTAPLQGVDSDVISLLNAPDSADGLQDKAVEVASALLQASADLFQLRTELMSKMDALPTDAAEVLGKYRGKKRKYTSLSDTREALEEQLDDASVLASAAWAHNGQVLNKWSSRARSDPAVSGTADRFAPIGGFKAINQSATAQIERALHPQAIGRLRERAQTWRGPARIRLPREDPEDPSGAKGLFDDTDFYHSLLRELIESRAAAGATGTSSMGEAGVALPAAGFGRDKGPKAPRDQKASKGRKLRYEVHEKILHFMPPIPRTTWGQGQTDRLFTQLAGGVEDANLGPDDDAAAAEPQEADQPDEGFRLFG